MFKKALFIGIDEKTFDKKYLDRIDKVIAKRIHLPKESPEITANIKDADCLLVGFAVPVMKEHVDGAPHLKYIGTLSVAFHTVDVDYAKKKGIVVSNIAGYCTGSVAEFIIAVLLEHLRQLEEGKKRGRNKNYDFAGMSAKEIRGKVFGVFGLGSIGKRTAELALGFGADVRYWSKHRKSDYEAKGVKYEDKDSLLKNADFISLNFSLNKDTEKFLDEKAFQTIKLGAVIIDTVPMESVDLDALIKRLEKGDITFIFDHSDEMKQEDLDRLSKYKNCIIYPPIAFISDEARINKQEIFISNLENFLSGNPSNVVNN